MSEFYGEIIDNRYHAPIYVMEEKYIRSNSELKNLHKIFWRKLQMWIFLKANMNDNS